MAIAKNTGLLFMMWVIIPLHRADNLELLLGTLRTHQKGACDEETVTLICPRGTTISIQVAQYGSSATQTSCSPELLEYPPVAVEVVGDTSCTWPNALQTVVEACQKKRQCKFNTSPKAFDEFRSKVGCENDVLHLSCNPHSRVAIYSAQYGRTEYDSIQCPQPRGMKEENDPADRWWGEAVPPAPAVAAVPPQRPAHSINATREETSIIPPQQHLPKEDQFDVMYVYIVAGVAALCILCMIIGVIRCVIRKQNAEQPKGPDVSATTDIPNGFNDSISEVDNDINITSLSGPVDLDSHVKQDVQIANVALSPNINRYVGRPVPNTYPHVSSNMYGQVAEFPIEMPLRTMPHGTLGRGVAVKTLPRVHMQAETDHNTRSLYRYSNAQYYFGYYKFKF
ncbi:unnamed protein product [Leptidea sinapis]|uniref:SUEL-type lectin domain-containing protein n=1 Tax=Leptidea sinapis TaxID=189913 RepID=A0A5E4R572_9NEOP|nr:unnamed protein product [Leptidea sinapis]